MKKLWLALALLVGLGCAPAFAQQNCLVPPNNPATPVVSSAPEGGHVLKASPGCLLSTYVYNTTTNSGYLMLLNSATIPVDGAVTPIECVPISPLSYQFINLAPQPPEWFSVGITAVFSTSGCFIKTIGTSAFFHALVQ